MHQPETGASRAQFSTTAAMAVIDTQVIMDWLVFKEPSVSALAAAVVSGRLRWIGTPAMLAELQHVLGRGVAADRAPDLPMIEQQFERHCQMQPIPPRFGRLVCRDPDDQMFIDLAMACQARWLISRDRAVLALARRARALQLAIVTPSAWLALQVESVHDSAAR